jgi:hypothetical protein
MASELVPKELKTLDEVYVDQQQELLPRLEEKTRLKNRDVTMRQQLGRGKLWHGELFRVACWLRKPSWLLRLIPKKELDAALTWAMGHELLDFPSSYSQLGDYAFLAARFADASDYYQKSVVARERYKQHREMRDGKRADHEEYGDLFGWTHGDMQGFRAWVGPPSDRVFFNHHTVYFELYLLGDDALSGYSQNEHAAEAKLREWVYEQWGRSKAPQAVEAVYADEKVARAAFWIGDHERAAHHATVALDAISKWSQIGTPSFSFDGSKGMRRHRLEGILLLAERQRDRSAARKAARHFRQAIVSSIKTHQDYPYDIAFMHLQACVIANILNERVEEFREAFPHLVHTLEVPRE